jgi:hypothetical protein
MMRSAPKASIAHRKKGNENMPLTFSEGAHAMWPSNHASGGMGTDFGAIRISLEPGILLDIYMSVSYALMQ